MDNSGFQKPTDREYGAIRQITALTLGSILFFVLIPLFLILASVFLDQLFQLPNFQCGLMNPFLGLLLFIMPGLSLAFWSIQVQVKLGKGTPVPKMPPRKLVVQGPYAHCRNPMVLGEILFYLGVTIWMGSFSALCLTAVVAAYLGVNIKVVGEKILEERFGSEYLEYKQRIPFMIPRLWGRKDK